MHFLTYVFIEQNTDIHTAVAQALAPFSADRKVSPWKQRLRPAEVEAMARHYGVGRSDLKLLAGRMEDWNGGQGGVDDRGLFAVHTYNPNATWDWYEIGGRWRGLQRGDVAGCTELPRRQADLKKRLPHDFLTPDGRWHSRTKYVAVGWLTGRLIRKPAGRWRDEFTRALDRWPGHRVVCVDRHH